MGILDRLETSFVTKFGPFIQENGTNNVEMLALANNQWCNKY